jgi:hypothetical protein
MSISMVLPAYVSVSMSISMVLPAYVSVSMSISMVLPAYVSVSMSISMVLPACFCIYEDILGNYYTRYKTIFLRNVALEIEMTYFWGRVQLSTILLLEDTKQSGNHL